MSQTIFQHNQREENEAHEHVFIKPGVVADDRNHLCHDVLKGHGCQNAGERSSQALANMIYGNDHGASTQCHNNEHRDDNIGHIEPKYALHHHRDVQQWEHITFEACSLLREIAPQDKPMWPPPSIFQTEDIKHNLRHRLLVVIFPVCQTHLSAFRSAGHAKSHGDGEVLAVKGKVVQFQRFAKLSTDEPLQRQIDFISAGFG
mmetsp:Transcript_51233/g.119539  ORF Transcript_51233/g.119539 Transcript_51233/m.119539 type:complete len:203 (-) Transcript_51233:249-857(-)